MWSSSKFIIPAKTIFLLVSSLLFVREGFSIALRIDGKRDGLVVPALDEERRELVEVDLECGTVSKAAGLGVVPEAAGVVPETVVTAKRAKTSTMLQRVRVEVNKNREQDAEKESIMPAKESMMLKKVRERMLKFAALLPKISFALILAMVVLHLHLASEYAVATNTTNTVGAVGNENWGEYADLSFDPTTKFSTWVESDLTNTENSSSWSSTNKYSENVTNWSQVWVGYSKYCEKHPDYCAAIGDWFRPLTSTFMHNNYKHLRGNVLGLLMYGLVVENRQTFASTVLLIVWVSACCTSGADIYRDDFHTTRRSAGMSGVVYGFGGSIVADLLMNLRELLETLLPKATRSLLLTKLRCLFYKIKRDRTDTSGNTTDETSTTSIDDGSVHGFGDKTEKLGGKVSRRYRVFMENLSSTLMHYGKSIIYIYMVSNFICICMTGGIIVEKKMSNRMVWNEYDSYGSYEQLKVSSTAIHWGHFGGLLGGFMATLVFGRKSELVTKTDFVGKAMTVLSLLVELLCCSAYTKLSVDLLDKPDSSKFYVWFALPSFWFKFFKELKIVVDNYSNDLASNTNADGPTLEEENGDEEESII